MKGKEPMGWKEYFLRFKSEDGVSYRKLARACGKSDAAVHALVSGIRPPTYSVASKIAEITTGMEKKIFLNIVFRDRLLHFLEKENLLTESPTEEIHKFVDAIRTWAPEKRGKILYIMLTFENNLDKRKNPDSNNIKDLGGSEMNGVSSTLNNQLRQLSFLCEVETVRAEFSEGLEGVTVLRKRT